MKRPRRPAPDAAFAAVPPTAVPPTAVPPGGLIATAANDITIPFWSGVLRPADPVLIERGGGQGLALYDEVARDATVHAVLQKRKFGVLARDWEVRAVTGGRGGPKRVDRQAVELITALLARIDFDRLTSDLLDAVLYGYAVAEIVWTAGPDGILPADIVAHDPRRFVFDSDGQPRLLTRAAPLDGIEIPARKLIVHRFGVRGNNPYGLGLGSKLYWPVLFKREGVAFWLKYLEKFAAPTPVGKYPLGMLPADQRRLLDNLARLCDSGPVVMPIGTEVDFMEAKRAGDGGYQRWVEYWDRQIALVVFGSTLATDVQGEGSRAASETHRGVEEEIADADADAVAATLKATLFSWVIELNLPGAAVPEVVRPRAINRQREEELRSIRAQNAKAELDNLFTLSARLPEDQVADIIAGLADVDLMPRVPPDVLMRLAPHLAVKRAAAVAAFTATQGDLGARLAAARQAIDDIAADFAAVSPKVVGGHDHGLTALVDQLASVADPAIAGLVADIAGRLDALAASGGGLDEVGDMLLAARAGCDVTPLGALIGDAVLTAELTGRDDVRAERSARKDKR